MKNRIAIIALSFIVPAAGAFAVSPAYAQTSASGATATTQAAPMTKEQKKAARKQARAKKNAELKKLEDAGYNPSRGNDPDYPQNLQNAQKKAGIGASAAQ